MCDVLCDAAAEEEEATGWVFPSNDFLLLGNSIADDVAHDTKKGSIARAQEAINSSFAFAFPYPRYCVRTQIRGNIAAATAKLLQQ